ncbi:MAG: cytochrome-c peroxidase [Vampirovibrio sp.]|nr:cytochrome-c peroxidase [Vampirovibrio sp.]
MKKRLMVPLVIFMVILAFPLSNFLHFDSSKDFDALVNALPNKRLQKVAPVFRQKCMDCHSAYTRKPFYASLPIANQIIKADVMKGNSRLDFVQDVFRKNGIPDEIVLARLEGVIRSGAMPPLRYRQLHWDANLTQEEQADILAWITDVRGQFYSTADSSTQHNGEIVQPISTISPNISEAKATLGDKLFHEPRLSAINTMSCASCHDLQKGGADQTQFGSGIGGRTAPINAPTVFNATYSIAQFWDGRAKDLVTQAKDPIHTGIKMGANWDEVVLKLSKDPEYVQAFQVIYEGEMTGDNIRDALAGFEQTLVTPNSPFDRYLAGDASALTKIERKGYALFKANNCTACHAGKTLGGLSFEKMGRKHNYFRERGGKLTKADMGRFNVTQNEDDRHVFKVPTLRNVALTAPYFHDGSAKTLKEAVRTMARVQTGKTLTDEETAQLIAFLKTLTGEYKGEKLK